MDGWKSRLAVSAEQLDTEDCAKSFRLTPPSYLQIRSSKLSCYLLCFSSLHCLLAARYIHHLANTLEQNKISFSFSSFCFYVRASSSLDGEGKVDLFSLAFFSPSSPASYHIPTYSSNQSMINTLCGLVRLSAYPIYTNSLWFRMYLVFCPSRRYHWNFWGVAHPLCVLTHPGAHVSPSSLSLSFHHPCVVCVCAFMHVTLRAVRVRVIGLVCRCGRGMRGRYLLTNLSPPLAFPKPPMWLLSLSLSGASIRTLSASSSGGKWRRWCIHLYTPVDIDRGFFYSQASTWQSMLSADLPPPPTPTTLLIPYSILFEISDVGCRLGRSDR